jgi:hypothetical protein
MKNILTLLVIVFVSTTSFSQSNSGTKAEFKFETELINYGKVAKNSDGKRVFKFTNIGKSPLIITDIKTSCDCAVPKKPEAPIMPGQKGEITVSYDTSKTGGFSKMITIFSNAKEKRKRIRIKGFVSK